MARLQNMVELEVFEISLDFAVFKALLFCSCLILPSYHSKVAAHSATVITLFANSGQMSSVAASVASMVNPAVVSFSIVTWYPLIGIFSETCINSTEMMKTYKS